MLQMMNWPGAGRRYRHGCVSIWSPGAEGLHYSRQAMARPVLFLTGNLTNIATTNYETGTCCTRFTLECTSGCLAGDSIPCEAWGNKSGEVAKLSSALFTGELSLGRKLLISEWAAA